MNYYKILLNPPKIGTTIDTEKNYDIERLNRFNKLSNLFNLIFELSLNFNMPLLNILTLLYPNLFVSKIIVPNQNTLEKKLEEIRMEIEKSKFNVKFEFRLFTDFVLNRARNEIIKEFKIPLPDRFKSQYFFESVEDCLQYWKELNSIHSCRIIQVEFTDIISKYKMDNKFLTNFENQHTSADYYERAKDFLMQKSTEEPLFEIIFQGSI